MPKSPLPRTAAALLTGALLLITAPTTQAAVTAPSAVHVNQLGYLPDGPKRATVVSASTTALPWQLRDASGKTAASGTTTARGADAASGDSTQLVDFSSYRGTGTAYPLPVDGRTSHPFDIRAGLYDGLRADAMSFFYQQRSGTPIEARLAGAAYARPAGHLGVAPNTGDTSVPCRPGE